MTEIAAYRRRIVLETMEIPVQIGIHDTEREAPQRVLIDVTLELSGDGPAWGRDRIADVLDYDFLHGGIVKLTADRRFNLQETLCAEIMEMCLARDEVVAARVLTRKPDIYPNCRSIGVEMERRKDPPKT